MEVWWNLVYMGEMSDDVIRVGAGVGEARAAVVLLHGRGSSGGDIAGLARAIAVEGVHWVAPTARGNTWYPRRFLEPEEENEPWLSRGLQRINGLVKELEAQGVAAERIGLAGFSQGACLALEYAVRKPRRYGFVAALSGALIGPLGREREELDLQGTPVLLACADEDAHIPLEHLDESERVLRAAKADVTRMRFPGVAHTVFPEELEWMGGRLRRKS